MIEYFAEVLTAKETAQSLISEAIRQAVDTWTERSGVDQSKLTDRERAAINDQLTKVAARLSKPLGQRVADEWWIL